MRIAGLFLAEPEGTVARTSFSGTPALLLFIGIAVVVVVGLFFAIKRIRDRNQAR